MRRACFLGVAVVAAAGPAAAGPMRVFTFGSSLDDDGGTFGYAAGSGGRVPSPAYYYNGAFTNGPVWVSRLADRLGAARPGDTNFAVGGATSRVFDPADPVQTRGGYQAQVAAFRQAYGRFGAADVAVVSGPGNDAPQIVDRAADGGPAAAAGVADSVAAVVRVLDQLFGLGARTFLVPNIPDLRRLPAAAADPRIEPVAAVADALNAGLRAAVADFRRRTGATVAEPDFRRAIDDIAADPSAYGIANVSQPVLASRPFVLAPVPNPVLGLTPGSTRADVDRAAERSLFFDRAFHPTSPAHQVLADTAYDALAAAQAPEPATAVLAVVGVAGAACGRLGRGGRLPRPAGRR